MNTPLIRISNIAKSFERLRFLRPATGIRAVANVTLSVERGKTLGIVGESGSGKSTLLRMVLRLIRPTAGHVVIDGIDIWTLRGAELKAFRRKVQPIFQNPASSFNPRHSIASILSAPLEVHGIGDHRSRMRKIGELLERVGLPADVGSRLPHQLSGGQKQRIAIARAIILEPEIVLADEPTSALDVSVQAQVLELFQQTRRDMGLTSIFVSHNLAVIRQVSDTIAVMRLGEVVEVGPADEIFANPRHDYTRALIAAVPDHGALMDQKEAEEAGR